jgi:AcrR family transcriptional regulator
MPPELNADVKRKQVVASAAELFDRDGYNSTNMTKLAGAVGLEKPTLYHYFSGKEEILFWIHEEFIDLLIAKAAKRAAQPGLSAAEELRGTMEDVLELMETHRGHVRVFFEHNRELAEERQTSIRAKRDEYGRNALRIVERGIAAGEFLDVDAQLVTFAMFGMCNWSYQWYRSGGTYTTEEIADFFHETLMNGITPRA